MPTNNWAEVDPSSTAGTSEYTVSVAPGSFVYELAGHDVKAKPPDYEALRPRLGWLPLDIVKQTLQSTTQHARIPMATLLKKHFKSPFPALNVFCRNEPVAMDTMH